MLNPLVKNFHFRKLANRNGLLCAPAAVALLALSTITASGSAQSGLIPNPSHAEAVKALQPSWIAPLFTPNTLLSELFRTSFVRQRLPTGISVWNMGNGKGASLITSSRTETDILVPSYTIHNDGKNDNGFGDMSVAFKYRIVSGNDKHGDYVVSALATNTWDTGSSKNGSTVSTSAFAINGGKGFRYFDVQSVVGVTLPASAGLASLGRPLAWNTVVQVHMTKTLWAEVESNSTFYIGGTKDGDKQSYVTPGLQAKGKPHSWGEHGASFAAGVGMQIATTHYRASDHNLILDARVYY